MTKNEHLSEKIKTKLNTYITEVIFEFNEVTVICTRENLSALLTQLRDLEPFCFEQLVDLCAVDYLTYGISEWETETAASLGFSRGVERLQSLFTEPSTQVSIPENPPRFAVVYHLLSLKNNHRLRVKTFLHEESLFIPSMNEIYASANWFEREAYDLFGILFENHPDLRRILTDYGFSGYPFRKDFPVSGHVEMRYDAKLQKVVYEPVDLEPRILVPKVIRHDNRYIPATGQKP